MYAKVKVTECFWLIWRLHYGRAECINRLIYKLNQGLSLRGCLIKGRMWNIMSNWLILIAKTNWLKTPSCTVIAKKRINISSYKLLSNLNIFQDDGRSLQPSGSLLIKKWQIYKWQTIRLLTDFNAGKV